MDDEKYLNEVEVSKMLGISLSTLRSNRSKKKGLPFIKIGRSVRYRLSDIQKYMEEHKVKTE